MSDSVEDGFGPGERDYIRLTTVGKIDVILPSLGDIQLKLSLLDMEGESAALAHAYEALLYAVEVLRIEEP
jgi:hypothetical protein